MPVNVESSPNSSLSSPQWQIASSDAGPVPISSSPSSSPYWNKSSSSDTQSSSPYVDPFATPGTCNSYDQVSESNSNFSPENRDEIATLLPSLLFEVAREQEALGSPAYARYLEFSPIKYAPPQQMQFKLSDSRSSSFSSSDLYSSSNGSRHSTSYVRTRSGSISSSSASASPVRVAPQVSRYFEPR